MILFYILLSFKILNFGGRTNNWKDGKDDGKNKQYQRKSKSKQINEMTTLPSQGEYNMSMDWCRSAVSPVH